MFTPYFKVKFAAFSVFYPKVIIYRRPGVVMPDIKTRTAKFYGIFLYI